VSCVCRWLESLQKKRRKLQSDRKSSVQCIKLLDLLLSNESNLDVPAQLHDKCEPVIRNSCALTLSSSTVPSPAVPEFRSDDRLGPLSGVLPLPVQNLNLEIMDSADTSDIVPMSQCGVSSVVAMSHSVTASFTSSGSVTGAVPVSYTETTSVTASQQQVSMCVKSSGHKLPSSANSSQNSLLLHSNRHSASASVPANGLVIPVTAGNCIVKTAKTQRLVPQTLATSKKAVIIAPSTSATTSNIQLSGKTTSVRIHNRQLVHLTIPTMLNLTGSDIQVQQFVSLPPHAVSSGIVPVCSAAVTCPVASIACSQPISTCTVTAKGTSQLANSMVFSRLQQSVASCQQLQPSPALHSTSVSCTQVTSCQVVSTQSASSNSVCCDSSVAAVPASCSTPPVSQDEAETAALGLSLLHDASIPDIPTPDPSCSSQE